MDKILRNGAGWRLGWDPNASEFKGLVGGDGWAVELTEPELDDLCRLCGQLADTVSQIAAEIMDSERLACEAESDRLWVQLEGFPHAYSLEFILSNGRRCEGSWPPEAVPELLAAMKILKMF
ncbi:MAG: DUF1818 family protein [Arthrospira sp. SH-MAG29]|nr:DUF1818 family protein [Arthrospira sp. SH-MAG29]MBS0015373.1 DUF1818 family protein [Arthrospira sp. SH-MAG29]